MRAQVNESKRLNTRTRVYQWLRKVHTWTGLWGALLGLLFGVTGIVQDHRAILKMPLPRSQESQVQLSLPNPAPTQIDAMASWLQQSLKLDKPPSRIKREPARAVDWGDKTLEQPEHWVVHFSSPQFNVQADFWMGNSWVNVKRSEHSLITALNNFHKGVGVGVGWILLADAFAGGLILLSLTGMLLWFLSTRRRVIGWTIGGVSTIITCCVLATTV